MFTEKNIPKLIIFTPIIAVALIAILTIFIFIETQNNYFEEESIRLETEFIQKQKRLLKKEIDTITNYITHQESIYTNKAIEKVIKRTFILSSRVKQLYSDLNLEVDSERQLEIVTNLINSKISNDSYFFAYDVNNNKVIQPHNKNIKKEFKEDDKFFENYLFSEEGKLISFESSNKIVYMKHLPELNWMIGNIENLNKDINFIKNATTEYISSIRFDKHGYFWIYDANHVLIADPFREDFIGQNEADLITQTGEYLIRDFVSNAISTDEATFVQFSWPKPNEKEYSQKIGYVKYFEKWNWVIGSGLYIDDIQESILENKINLENRIKKYIEYIIFISISIVFVIGIISIVISNKISRTFKNYQKSVKVKENILEKLNKNLEEKVQKGIAEAQDKDRAMLHQSRLARLGTMISMIAHQWRQPLTEVSGILMELETATKFNKVDDKLILECTKESDKLLSYMSNTIDDFRNFFKPDKKKDKFSITSACEKSLSIVEATLKELNITVIKDFRSDLIVSGYAREFSQVILNIFLNCKDTFIDKKITNAKIEITIEVKSGKSKISIADNAGGIKEKNIDVIFEPYFTTKSSSKGTGLGLYMSKMIIEKNMHGKLNVRNSSEGAVFEILI
ncbi:MAG: cache domain-containing protein [Campylobacteraceae bacterium]|nr:cache domain-containing protein [Campylobacteraceae bacterium]